MPSRSMPTMTPQSRPVLHSAERARIAPGGSVSGGRGAPLHRRLFGAVKLSASPVRAQAPHRRPRVDGSGERTRSRQHPWIYVRHALVHPWHIVVLAGATVFGVANWSLWVLLMVFVAAEVLLLGLVLQLPSFRRYVDERFDRVERARAAEARATALLRISDDHRRELLRLEATVDRIRDITRPSGAEAAADECQRLLGSYVRLAISHNVSRECLAAVDRRALGEETAALDAARFARSAHARALGLRRLAIAKKRLERWDRSKEALEAISHQLAMIAELIQLAHEQVSAPGDPTASTDEIDVMALDLEHEQSTLAELADLLVVEETIDPLMLERGRASRG